MSKIILLVSKSGEVKELTIKTFDPATLYKKANTTVATGFKIISQWPVRDGCILLYGKLAGAANTVNQYEFPNVKDTYNTIYGHCLIVGIRGNFDENVPITFDIIDSLTEETWVDIRDSMIGGIIDLDNEDEQVNTKLEDQVDMKILYEMHRELSGTTTGSTIIKIDNNGYARDGFVVSDDEEPDNEEPTPKCCNKVPKNVKKTVSESVNAKSEELVSSTKPRKTGKKLPILTDPRYHNVNCERELTLDSYV